MPGGARDRRVQFEAPLRYRRVGDSEWHFGNTIDASGSGLLFFCDNPLEVGAEVEVILPAMAQQAGSISQLDLAYVGRVVRRVLPAGSEGRPAVAISVSRCHIASCQAYRYSDPGGNCRTEAKR